MGEMKDGEEARVRVVLADDHALVREGIRQFLEQADSIEVLAEAGDGAEAVRLTKELAPDVVVMDIRMPQVTGVEATRRIKQYLPEVKVMVLTAYDDDPYIHALLQAGADGYVLKTAPARELIAAVQSVARGEAALSPAVAAKVIRQMTHPGAAGGVVQVEGPTEREVDVLRRVAQGMTNREIGRELEISHRTVQGHLANVYEKLNVNSRTEAVTEALRRGWITIE